MLNEANACFAHVTIGERVRGCWLGKAFASVLCLAPDQAHDLSPSDYRAAAESAKLWPLFFDVANLNSFKLAKGRPSSFDLANSWLKLGPSPDRSFDDVFANLSRGLLPPLSGSFRRSPSCHSHSWQRMAVWSCLGLERPKLLAKTAYADSEIDNGISSHSASAAFVASLQANLLAGIPPYKAISESLREASTDSGLASLVRSVVDLSVPIGVGSRTVHSILEEGRSLGCNQSEAELGALLFIWLSGQALNDCITLARSSGLLSASFAAALGGLVGLSTGLAAIPKHLAAAVQEAAKSVKITNRLTINLDEFVWHINELMQDDNVARICKFATVADPGAEYKPKKREFPHLRSPYKIAVVANGLEIELDYIHEPEFFISSSRMVSLSVRSLDQQKRKLRVRWSVGDNASVGPSEKDSVLLPGTKRIFTTNVLAHRAADWIQGSVSISSDAQVELMIPFALASARTVRYDSLTLKPGVTVQSDSESESLPGSTRAVIDGKIVDQTEASGEYWESEAGDTPHWVQVNLPKPMRTNRVIVHFADKDCHPVDFCAEVSDDGIQWEQIGAETEYQNNTVYELGPFDMRIKHFRYTVYQSSGILTPSVAKLSEIEMIPLGRGRNRVR